jgi:hypothetical protein
MAQKFKDQVDLVFPLSLVVYSSLFRMVSWAMLFFPSIGRYKYIKSGHEPDLIN